MWISKLRIVNFKQYPSADLSFQPGFNCICGLNGGGKTSLLDAVYYLALTKSFLNASDQQNIREGENMFVIEGSFCSEADDLDVLCVQKKGQPKELSVNRKAFTRLGDHIGKIPLVLISPEDQRMILDGSEVRRKFLDGMIAQLKPHYLDHLLRYNKVLHQRNVLLKQSNPSYPDQLMFQTLDEQLLQEGLPILSIRNETATSFPEAFRACYHAFVPEEEEAEWVYLPSVQESSWADDLQSSLTQDLHNGYTGKGIHKDDWQFKLFEKNAKRMASQGQQKSLLLALKLAQYQFLAGTIGEKPLLLIDDICDRLDENRLRRFLHLLNSGPYGQVLITDTHPDRVAAMLRADGIQPALFTPAADKSIMQVQ